MKTKTIAGIALGILFLFVINLWVIGSFMSKKIPIRQNLPEAIPSSREQVNSLDNLSANLSTDKNQTNVTLQLQINDSNQSSIRDNQRTTRAS